MQWGRHSPTQVSTLGTDLRDTRKDPHTQADLLGRQTALHSRSYPVSKGINNNKKTKPKSNSWTIQLSTLFHPHLWWAGKED